MLFEKFCLKTNIFGLVQATTPWHLNRLMSYHIANSHNSSREKLYISIYSRFNHRNTIACVQFESFKSTKNRFMLKLYGKFNWKYDRIGLLCPLCTCQSLKVSIWENQKKTFFFTFPFWFHIWRWNIYCRCRNPFSRFTSILEPIERLKPNNLIKS